MATTHKPSKKKEVTEETASKIQEITNILNRKENPRFSVVLFGKPVSDDSNHFEKHHPSIAPSDMSISVAGDHSGESEEDQEPISSPSSGSSLGDLAYEAVNAENAQTSDHAEELEDAEEERRHLELSRAEIETATAQLEKQIAAMEEEKAKTEVKRKEAKKQREEQEAKDREVEAIWAKTFVPVGRQMQMLKTSMRFIPTVNTTPNVTGSPDDPPFLFKNPGRVVDRKRKADYTVGDRSTPNTPLTPVTPTTPPPPTSPSGKPPKARRPVFGLNWPSQGSQLVYRSHHNLLVAFLSYYNKKAEAESLGFSGTDLYDPNLSISCALACGKSPYPPKKSRLLGTMPIPTMSSDLYTPLQIATAAASAAEDWKSVANQIGFWPQGFGPQRDGTFVPLPLEYYMPQDQPYFPDPADFTEIPRGSQVGYLDSSGNFYIPEIGDALPPDASIGYLDEDGVYHHVIDLKDGMTDGRIPYKPVYPFYPSDEDDDLDPYGAVPEDAAPRVSFPFPHGELPPGQFPGPGFRANYPTPGRFVSRPSIYPPGFPGKLPEAKGQPLPPQPPPPGSVPTAPRKSKYQLDTEEDYLPGDPRHHQSEAVFVGEGQISAKKNDWENLPKDGKKKKRKKARKQRGTIYLPDSSRGEDGEEEGEYDEEEEDEWGEDEDWGSDLGSDEDEEDEENEEEEEEPQPPPYPTKRYSEPNAAAEAAARPGPPIRYDSSAITEDLFPDNGVGYTKTEMVSQVTPHGAQAGYLDANGDFVLVGEGEEFPEHVNPGYMDEHGVFHQILLPHAKSSQQSVLEASPAPAGFLDENGVFRSTQPEQEGKSGSIFGFVDEGGVFQQLFRGETAPPGSMAGHLDKSGMFHPAKKLPDGVRIGVLDETGVFQPMDKIPPGGVGGYMDPTGVFHKAPPPPKRQPSIVYEEDELEEIIEEGEEGAPGHVRFVQKKKKKSAEAAPKPKRYIEDANELIEVEIRDEENLDEEGRPTVKVVLRHRGSIAAPADARETDEGGKVWMEGDEEVTEMPYMDHNDLDDAGKPKIKRMRVRKRLGFARTSSLRQFKKSSLKIIGKQKNRRSRIQKGENLEDSEYDLGSQPLTAAERERLLEFQRNVAVQVEMDYIEGSLDLGEVVRKSFRIYSHGGSIDIDPGALVRQASIAMAAGLGSDGEEEEEMMTLTDLEEEEEEMERKSRG